MTGDRHHFEVVSSQPRFSGAVFDVRTDAVRMPGGTVAHRDVVVHPGAVAILALDADGSVVMVRQYRHAVGQELLELPAGLLDVDGEAALAGARRELFEEAAEPGLGQRRGLRGRRRERQGGDVGRGDEDRRGSSDGGRVPRGVGWPAAGGGERR